MVMRRFLPSLSALSAFDAAARHLNFTRAAEDIGVTQSGISRQIKALEAFLGTRLFDRLGPRLILTESGKSYAADVAGILDHVERVSIDVVRGYKAESALLIGAHSTIASRWIAPCLGKFAERFPDSLLEIDATDGDINFSDTNFDLAVLRGRGNWKDAHAAHMFDERFVVVASPSLIPLGEVLEPASFRDFTQLQNSARSDSWMRWLQGTGQSLSGRLFGPRLGHTSMLINAAISGVGIAVVPDFTVQRELASGLLHAPFDQSVPSGEAYYAVYPENKAHHRPILNFRDWLKSESKIMRRS